MKKFFVILILVGTTNGWASPQPSLTSPFGVKMHLFNSSDSIRIRDIKLGDYLKNISPDKFVDRIDSLGKDKPDIFVVYVKKDNGARSLVMQLFDLNRDGRIDLVKFYEKEKLVRSEADLNYDGIVDLVTEYDPNTGEVKKKIQTDGNTQIWSYYFKKELRRKEVDRNFDGKPDMWVYYKSGKAYRTEIDKNFDGKVVRVDEKYTH